EPPLQRRPMDLDPDRIATHGREARGGRRSHQPEGPFRRYLEQTLCRRRRKDGSMQARLMKRLGAVVLAAGLFASVAGAASAHPRLHNSWMRFHLVSHGVTVGET